MLDEIMDHRVEKVVITYKDRLSRVGFELFMYLFRKFRTEVNEDVFKEKKSFNRGGI